MTLYLALYILGMCVFTVWDDSLLVRGGALGLCILFKSILKSWQTREKMGVEWRTREIFVKKWVHFQY
jgi:hypothetical protein